MFVLSPDLGLCDMGRISYIIMPPRADELSRTLEPVVVLNLAVARKGKALSLGKDTR